MVWLYISLLIYSAGEIKYTDPQAIATFNTLEACREARKPSTERIKLQCVVVMSK